VVDIQKSKGAVHAETIFTDIYGWTYGTDPYAPLCGSPRRAIEFQGRGAMEASGALFTL
jgi:hypothetical protein